MRVLAAWELGSGFGHVSRLRRLRQAAIALGHEFHLVYPKRAIFGALATEDIIACSPVAYDGRSVSRDARVISQIVRPHGFWHSEPLNFLIDQWHVIFKSMRTEVVICDFAPSAMLAAYLVGIKAVQVGTAFTAQPGGALPNLRPWVISNPAQLNKDETCVDSVLKEVCRAYQRTPLSFSELLGCSPPLLTSWPELDHIDGERPLPRFGPLQPLEGAKSPKWEGCGRRKALVYYPEHGAASASLEGALRLLGWSALWFSGVDATSGSIVKSAEPLDLVRLIPEADIVLGRGGHGLCSEAFRHGTVQFAIPDQLEAALLTFRLRERGISNGVPMNLVSSQLIPALEATVEDQGLKDAAYEGFARYEHYNGAEEAMRLIDSVQSLS